MTSRIDRVRALLASQTVGAFIVQSATNRRYLSGFTGSAGMVMITADQAYLLTDFRYTTQAKEQAPDFDIVEIKGGYDASLARIVASLGIRTIGFEARHVSVHEFTRWQTLDGGLTWVPTEQWIEELRAVKYPDEIHRIEAAVALGDRAFAYIVPRLQGRTEKEVALDLEMFMRREGAEKMAFDPIVASGEQGALPHATPTDRRIDRGDMVTLDFGAQVDGYCGDMTRTVVIGAADDKQRAVYDLVLTAQKAGVEGVQPGRRGQDVDQDVRRIIADAGYGEAFGHGLGHGVGLDVHENPPVLSPRGSTTLAPGMVTSVEPGVYLPGWGGVRIEDLVVVTPSGCRVMTQSPKELLIV